VTDIRSLLTSTKWTEPADDKSKGMTGIYNFNDNGSYVENYYSEKSSDKFVVTGTWKWISETEVSLLHNSMTVNGEIYDFESDDRDRYILRITEITKDRLKAIRRHSGDTEDSGFANQVTFEATGR
jgi:hypothetical protein